MKREINYLDLARAAVEQGNFDLFWKYLKQQARLMRKLNKTPAGYRSR